MNYGIMRRFGNRKEKFAKENERGADTLKIINSRHILLNITG